MFYKLARQDVFWTIQGEGALLGTPMVFIRFGGCSIGCLLCDTDYRIVVWSHIEVILKRVREASASGWVWLTGGEPTDQDLKPLIWELRKTHRVALATAGVKSCDNLGVDFLSVSPHHPDKWTQRSGSEVKLVPGLNGYHLADFAGLLANAKFDHKYVCPCDGDKGSIAECLAWVRACPDWRMGIQAHKSWKLP
jgi:organic radical activating enzyme